MFLLRILLLNSLFLFSLFALDWKPVSDQQRLLASPKLDKDADAEAIFWEVWSEDSIQGSYGNHRTRNYVRIKLFNERGMERHGNVELKYSSDGNMSIFEIRGRTIQPDGTILELKNDAVFDTVKAKVGKQKYKAKTFAMPGLKPGAIIEYQWVENYAETIPNFVKLNMQLELPAWEINYYVKPLTSSLFPYRMQAMPFHCKPSAWETAGNGFQKTVLKDVPAYVEEPAALSEDNVRAWMLLYYVEEFRDKPVQFWKAQGKRYHEILKDNLRASDEIKALAAEVTAGKNTPIEKLQALSEWCRVNIRNITFQANGVSSEMRDAYWKKPNRNAGDTLKSKIGNLDDVNYLFASLAQAAGFEPHLVRVTSANGANFRLEMMNTYLLSNRLIGVLLDGKAHFFNPGVPFVPSGMVDLDEEGQSGVMSDSKEPTLVNIPFSMPNQNRRFRNAKLNLQADGSISGEVFERWGGQFSVSRKRQFQRQSPAERDASVKEELERQFAGAEISDLQIVNAESLVGDVQLKYQLKMAAFGERTGKRIFFPASLFGRGAKPRFTASTRHTPIFFSHAFDEYDLVSVQWPEGYVLENPEQPGITKLGDVGQYRMEIRLLKKAGAIVGLTTERELVWGQNENLFFGTDAYPLLKTVWERVSTLDGHMLTLKQQ